MADTPLHEITTSRWLPAGLERAINATLSRGPGYEPTPRGPAFDSETVRGYFIDFRSKTLSAIASDTTRLLPITLAQLALGWWERSVAGEADALDRFLDVAALLQGRGEAVGEELRWPAHVAVAKYGLAPGWCSSLSQSQAASVFVRAHMATGEARYGDVARRAILPLLSDRSTDLVSQTAAGPIFEEAPSLVPSHILNGRITALWGLWDVHRGLGDERAGSVFDAGADCLLTQLHAYDAGWWSRYSLYPHALQDLAKPIYHRYHIDQLTIMHELTGEQGFGEAAARWDEYDRPALRGCALAQKAAFAATDRSRRSRWRASDQRPLHAVD